MTVLATAPAARPARGPGRGASPRRVQILAGDLADPDSASNSGISAERCPAASTCWSTMPAWETTPSSPPKTTTPSDRIIELNVDGLDRPEPKGRAVT